ncbi:transmembrane protease serine 2-like [Myripristis murdjan]|uniref:transmembrane protease serine 2-like n=1 Tax=Myripristis murdjan TaxID=586833 RepID=UPI001175C8E3|nr:transmembrane protease serine 2-like [Myripristis murdjan]
MTTNPYLDAGPYFVYEGTLDGEWRPRSFSSSEDQPQYVHHLTPKPEPLPPPDMSHSVPHHKGIKQRCIKFSVAAVISLLLLLLVALILLGYYLSSTCIHGVACGDGSCVWASQWCDGVQDCPGGQDEASCVRLYGPSFLLQIYCSESKSWRTVCSHGWTEQQGKRSRFPLPLGTYFKSDQQKTESRDGFLKVKPGSGPDTPILKQLVRSDSCPNNSVVTLRCIDCGSLVNSSRALGVQPASLETSPWQVSLQVEGSHRCGGAIITPYWIVTAAHCVAGDSNPEDWTVYAGIMDSLGTLFNPARSVSRIVVHKDYSSLTLRNDIALMKLSNPLDFTASGNIAPVCLPNVELNISVPQRCWTSGFQIIDSGSLHLKEAEVSLVDRADCNTSYNGRITEDMLCAGATEAGVDVCHGDSGGPLVSQKAGVWWLIGDSSWGDQCTVRNKPGVYGNVTYFLSWIYRHMRVGVNSCYIILKTCITPFASTVALHFYVTIKDAS